MVVKKVTKRKAYKLFDNSFLSGDFCTRGAFSARKSLFQVKLLLIPPLRYSKNS